MNHLHKIRTLSMLLAAALLLPLVGCTAADLPSDPAAEKPEPSEKAMPDAGVSVHTLAAPVYPTEKEWAPLSLPEGTDAFWQRSLTQFLSGAGSENRVFSPVNVYLALAMLAETTDNNSRAQLLSLLGADSLETLREQAAALWESCYTDGEAAKVTLGSSLWTRNDLPYNAQTMQNLAQYYYAYAFSGKMGSAEYNEKLQSWINEQTGDLLADQVGELEMDLNTVLALVTTLYLKAPWSKQFAAENTVRDSFHAENGPMTCAFLCENETYTVYRGEHFTAIGKPLAEVGTMYFLLPDEGVSPEALLQDEDALRFLAGDSDAAERSQALVHLKLPKFDISSQLGLIEGLKALGVTDVFDDAVSDFTPLTDAVNDLYVSQAQHGARVKIDEEGCEAAAYTMITITTKMARPIRDEIDFVLDRPFVFGVLTYDNVPLFTGIVNRPIEA